MNAPTPLPYNTPARAGQGTLVEQSRAQAEVMAAMMAAKQDPRDEQVAQHRMEQVCGMPALAERAFFRFPRGGQNVTGPSVHLARELARCWGNVHYEVKELARDDDRAQSEMQALAWDLETNARSSAIFIVPHKRDERGGPKQLTDMRDIYENNANAGARRLRECLFAVLPLWYVEAAKDLCTQTVRDGGGVPLPQRIKRVIELFSQVRVTKAQLEQKIGTGTGNWTEQDIALLHPIFQSIQRGEVTKETEFPAADATVSLDELGARRGGSQQSRPASDQPAPDAEPKKTATKPAAKTEPTRALQTEFPPVAGQGDDEPCATGQRTAMTKLLAKGGIRNDTDALAVLARIAGRTATVEHLDRITAREARQVIEHLDGWQRGSTLADQLAAVLAAARPATEEALPDPEADPEGWHRAGHPRHGVEGGPVLRDEHLPNGCELCAP